MEKRMFMAVKSVDDAPCQKDIESFIVHRSAQFSAWTKEVLLSYLHDLELASQQGINFMTLKYARMDNMITVLNENPLIGKILEISKIWQQEIIVQYPGIMKGARPLETEHSSGNVSYLNYLKAELETYSDRTLELLYNLIQSKLEKKLNMSGEVYQYLVVQMGYKNISEAETRLQEKT